MGPRKSQARVGPDGEKPPDDLGLGGLGTRLREIRLGQGRSVRSVATDAGVSHGLLSQVERGLTRPSFPTLVALANVLGVPLAELFVIQGRPERVVRRSDRPRELHTSVHATDFLLTPDNRGEFSVVMTRILPLSTSGGAYRHRGGQEFLYLVRGDLIVIVGDEEHPLAAGDAITLTASEPHGWRNESSEAVEAIWVVSNRVSSNLPIDGLTPGAAFPEQAHAGRRPADRPDGSPRNASRTASDSRSSAAGPVRTILPPRST